LVDILPHRPSLIGEMGGVPLFDWLPEASGTPVRSHKALFNQEQ